MINVSNFSSSTSLSFFPSRDIHRAAILLRKRDVTDIRGYIRGSPDAIIAIAIVQRTGGRRGQRVVGADDSRAIVRVPPGDVSLQVLGLRRRVDAPIPMMMMVVVQMMVAVSVVGRPRDRLIAVRHRVRHEGHHFMRLVVGSVRSLAPVTAAVHLDRRETVLEARRTSTRSPPSELITSGELLTDSPADSRFFLREWRVVQFNSRFPQGDIIRVS